MLKLSVGGDAEGGYLVDVHDGDKQSVQSPEGASGDWEAVALALKAHDPLKFADAAKAFAADEIAKVRAEAHDEIAKGKAEAQSSVDAAEAEATRLRAELDAALKPVPAPVAAPKEATEGSTRT